MYPNTCTKVTIVYFPVFSALFFNGKKEGLQVYCRPLLVYVKRRIIPRLFFHTSFFLLGTQGFLIDGFPLDDEQAEAFVSDIGQPTAVILLEANDTILVERLKKRFEKIVKNRRNFFLIFFLHRNNFDDTEEAIKKRVENYNAKTKSVAQKFNAKVINAERPCDDIFADVQKVMDAM